ALHAAAEDQHRVAMAVVRAAVAVLAHGSPELGHRDDHHVAEAIAKVDGEGRDSTGEVVEAIGELAGRAPFVRMMIPSPQFGERYLEADVRLDQLRGLPDGLAEARPRVAGAAGRTAGTGRGLAKHPDGIERLTSGGAQ